MKEANSYMNLVSFHKLIKEGRYLEYVSAVTGAFYRENADLFTGIVVEAGCGPTMSYRADSDDSRYIGVDLSIPKLLKNNSVDFKICADVGYFPLKNSSVDLIVCRDLVEHLYNPEQFFAETNRCLKQRGAFIISTPSLYGGVSLPAKFIPRSLSGFIWRVWKKMKDPPGYPFIYKANTKRALCRLASNNGLRVESVSYINIIPHWFHRMPVIGTMIYAYGQFVGKIGLVFLQTAMIVTLRKCDSTNQLCSTRVTTLGLQTEANDEEITAL